MNESTVSVAIVNDATGETVKRINGEKAKILQDEYFRMLETADKLLPEIDETP